MASKEVSISNCTGVFNFNDIEVYNLINISKYITAIFEDTHNFCCSVGLIKGAAKCPRCRWPLKLSSDKRDDRTTPIVFRCTNSRCTKYTKYFSLHERSLFEGSKLPIEQIPIIVALITTRVTNYEQIQFQAQIGREKLSTETIADWLSYCR